MIGESLQRALRLEGYAVDWVRDAAAADGTLASERFDLVLLDLGLPPGPGAGARPGDGLAVLRALRARHDATPVIVLTARDARGDRVAGLDAGADDYLVKPFALDELTARLRALLRRTSVTGHEVVIQVDDLVLDPLGRTASRGGQPLDLTKTEFDLLELLMVNDGVVLPRDVIYERIWGFDFETSSRSLDVYVGYLRTKTELDDAPRLLHTVRGVGYVLRAPQDQADA